ncbi:hypothetical protein BCF33_0602 [Hasllibacter halocynthiae]|uniref:Uncharacterized protein n=1 Tax=Hasllibacter halocynthiae TaxID=595589 RepID=A0A2T0X7R7_9RHOB|nr:hypothetical protein [Hasllibacter halocynthiae]PRY94991.1 hypothetical protein BCF33_0602 [Hasllibacter halocynthiae]
MRRRRAFYLPGYDPFHPRRYRELYRREGARQAELSGYEIALTPKEGPRYGWTVTSVQDGAPVRTEVDVFVWSDLVRGSMSASISATYWQLVRTAWVYVASGTLRRLTWLRRGPVVAALYPAAVLIGQLLLSLLAAWIAASILASGLAALLGLAGRTPWPWLTSGLWWAAFLGGIVVALRWWKRQDRRFYAHYLMHDYAFAAKLKGATPPELKRRTGAFACDIAAALEGDWDEVLVVGHSSGAHLAVSAVAEAVRGGAVRPGGPVLSLLTLGQVMPMVSFLPRAEKLRGDLAFLSASDALTWVDVTAPGDGCAFALCDPVAVSGVQPDGARWPLVLSCAFTRYLRPETLHALRHRYFRLHFQYLCAFDRLRGEPGEYDYFRVTAGPLTLAERFRGRRPSPSRIDVPASAHVSVPA